MNDKNISKHQSNISSQGSDIVRKTIGIHDMCEEEAQQIFAEDDWETDV